MTPSLQITVLTPSSNRPDIQWSLPTISLRQLSSDDPGRQLQGAARAPDLLVLAGYATDTRLLQAVETLSGRMPAHAIAVVSGMPEADFLMALMRLGVREVWPNLNQSHVEAFVRRSSGPRPAADTSTPQASCVVTGFVSAKGGDGGSFVAANLGTALGGALSGRVLLIDLALPFGDIGMFLPARKLEYDLADFCEDTTRLDAELIELMAPEMLPGLRFIPSLTDFDRLSAVSPQQLERLIRRLAAFFDHILVDLGSGISPVAVNLMNLIDRLVVVATPTVPSLRRTSQILRLWERMERNGDALKVVLNRQSRRWDLPADKFEKTLGRAVDYRLPNQPEVASDAVIAGMPVVRAEPRSELALSFEAWVGELTGKPVAKEEPLWRRLMTR